MTRYGSRSVDQLRQFQFGPDRLADRPRSRPGHGQRGDQMEAAACLCPGGRLPHLRLAFIPGVGALDAEGCFRQQQAEFEVAARDAAVRHDLRGSSATICAAAPETSLPYGMPQASSWCKAPGARCRVRARRAPRRVDVRRWVNSAVGVAVSGG